MTSTPRSSVQTGFSHAIDSGLSHGTCDFGVSQRGTQRTSIMVWLTTANKQANNAKKGGKLPQDSVAISSVMSI